MRRERFDTAHVVDGALPSSASLPVGRLPEPLTVHAVKARLYTALGWLMAAAVLGLVLVFVWGWDWRGVLTGSVVVYVLAWAGLFGKLLEWIELMLELDLNRDGLIGVMDDAVGDVGDRVLMASLSSGEVFEFVFPDKVQFARWLKLALDDQQSSVHSLSQNDANKYGIGRETWRKFYEVALAQGWLEERKRQKPIVTGEGSVVFGRWLKNNTTPLPQK